MNLLDSELSVGDRRLRIYLQLSYLENVWKGSADDATQPRNWSE